MVGVVVGAPVGGQNLCLLQAGEHLRVQQLIAKDQLRVIPTAMTIVSASTASAQARNTQREQVWPSATHRCDRFDSGAIPRSSF